MLSSMDAAFLAQRAWLRINRKPKTITIKRKGETLAEQTVRLELGSIANDERGENAMPGVQRIVIFGVKDHPTVADTDIKSGDRFNVDNKQYEVVSVVDTIVGEIQAVGEARK
jgi:hypothetical protein